MRMNRCWAMPNKETFKIKPIRELLSRYMNKGWWVDPMCGHSNLVAVRNDLDPSTGDVTESHLDAVDFLNSLQKNQADGVLFDPPYSPRQVSECYKKLGKTVNMETTQSSYWRKVKDAIDRLVKRGGYVISFGWNSNGMGKKRGYEIHEILLVAHGGHHNDTIVTVEQKIQGNLI